jgi:opine dehydrogenase
MREDVACGLAFLVSLGEWLNIPVPVASGLLALASSVIGEDLNKTGRTMGNLGLSTKTVEQVKDILEKGVIQYEIN